MSSITLRRVRSFVAVADLGGFRKAAEEFSIEKASIQRGRAIVASVPSIAANALPNILTAFMKEHPGIVVQVLQKVEDTTRSHLLAATKEPRVRLAAGRRRKR